MTHPFSRRNFFKGALMSAGAAALGAAAQTNAPKIQGFDETNAGKLSERPWKPVSDRKVKVGIAGYGVCKFGAAFGFQSHPNVDVVAATDLDPAACAELAKVTGAKKTYASCEEMFEKDKEIEAVFIATDAPSHARLCIAGLKRGLHMASAVPAVFGEEQLGLAKELLRDGEERPSMIYAMFETSSFHEDNFAMHQIYKAGGFGKLIYSEGEYYHYSIAWTRGTLLQETGVVGLPPQLLSDPFERLLHLRDTRLVHVCDVPGDAERHRCLWQSPPKNRVQQPLRHGNRAFSHERGRHVTHGGRAGTCRARSGEKGRVYGQKGAFEEQATTGRRMSPRSIRPNGSCRREWMLAGTAGRTGICPMISLPRF